MNEKLESLKRRLRIAYSDIIRGYTYNKKYDCFIKHFNDEDLGIIGEQEYDARRRGRERGLLTEAQEIAQLIENGTWSNKEEGELNSLAASIGNLKDSEGKYYGNEREKITRQVEEQSKKLEKLGQRRRDIVGLTIEKYADRKRSDYSIFLSFYKDRKCTKHLWTDEEFDYLDHEELYDAIKEFNNSSDHLSHYNIERIATQPYFLNKFFIANGDPMVFFGKPAVSLSQFQSELMGQGRMYKSILENNEKGATPPESYYADPDKLVKWYYSQSKGAAQSSVSSGAVGGDAFHATSVPGADMEELTAIAQAAGDMPVDLNKQIQQMKKSKGKKELDMIDMLQIHGEDTSCLPGGRR